MITKRKRPTGNKGAQRSATNVSIQPLGQDGGTETNTMDRGSSQRVTETSQGGNKKRIDWPCRSEAVNERGGGGEAGWGGWGGARLLPSRQQGRKRREEVGFNQTLSRSVCSEWAPPPGCWGASEQCMLGWGARPLRGQRQKHHHYNPYYSSRIIMQIPDGGGDAFRSYFLPSQA